MSTGYVTQVMGPVVDVKFDDDQLPDIYNALVVHFGEDHPSDARELTLEVALHLGDRVVRTIAMASTDGVKRGMEVTDQEGPITVPVGNETLGRVFYLSHQAEWMSERIFLYKA